MTVDAAPIPQPMSSRYPWTRAAWVALAIAALYALLPRLAPAELVGDTEALLLGVVNGVAVGIGLRSGRAIAVPVALGASVGLMVGYGAAGHLHWFIVGVAALIGLELAAMVAWLGRSGAFRFRHLDDLMRYALAILVISSLGAVVAATLATASPDVVVDNYLHAWRSWVIDDLFGLVCIAPAVVTIRMPRSIPTRRMLEWGLAAAYTAVSTWYVFFHVQPDDLGLLGWPYLVVLGQIWIAVRMGMRAVAPVVAVGSWFAVVGTIAGGGAFTGAAPDLLDRLLAVEMFCVVMAAVVFSLAVLHDERLVAQGRLQASERLLREVVDGSDSIIFAKSYVGPDRESGRYVLVNRQWEAETAKTEDETIGRTDRQLWSPEVAQAFADVDARVLAEQTPVVAEERNIDRGGRIRDYHSSKFPLRGPDGSVWGVGGIARDVTDELRAREREERQADLLHAVFELSPTPAIRLTLTGGAGLHVHAANAAMCRLVGASVGRLADCDLMDHIHPDDTATAIDVLSYAATTPALPGAPAVRQRELRMLTEDGHTVWVLMSAAGLRAVDGETEVVAQFEDFTARRLAEEALSDQAMRDAVTGLPNRRALQERMGAALQRLRRHPGNVTVLFCDLDHFKDVNDSLGHAVGDRLLVEVADRLRGALRPEDTIARLGGDEFVALGEGISDPSDAVVMAMRLQDKLSSPWVFEDQVFRPAMSIGIAMTTTSDVSVDEMLRRADLAMYRAKDGGRNRIEMYDRSVDDEVQRTVSVQHALRRAIDTDALVLHYQPIVQLHDGLVVGAEALVRMRDETGRLLPPSDFVPQAEATGLVVPMGAWVVQQALSDLAQWRLAGREFAMSINVSPTQLREEGFATYFLEQVAFAGVRPEWLAVEVTETALIHDPGRSNRELAELSAAGVRVSLDDFGTGYSSLSWLTQFPVNIVKIDKSFTDDVGLDERKTAIVSAVIAVSHELGFTVVAEGIESREQAERLMELGCDRGQGYLYGKPTSIGEPPWT